jgi:type I restriction enzyme S subunit
MKSDYKRLGNYIEAVNRRNVDCEVTDLRGLSLTKEFRSSTSNIVGTDMSTYKIMHKYDFAANFMGLGVLVDKAAIVLKLDEKPNIVSGAYPVFKVKDENVLHPEYLIMWLIRPEFDRFCVFKSDRGIRGGFDWNDLLEVELPIPHISKQREIVKEYNTIQNRIKLNEQLIQKLEETAQAIYREWFVEFEFPDENGKPYKSNGGVMVWNEELGKEIPKGWNIRKLKTICEKIGSGSTPTGGKESYSSSGTSLIRSTNVFDYYFSFEDLVFINDEQANKLKNVKVEVGDILLNITGVSVARCCLVPVNVLPARVNQHVMIIRPLNGMFISAYLLLTLCSTDSKNTLLGISQSGSTREAITKSEVEKFEIILPNERVLSKFESLIKPILQSKDLKNSENQKLSELKDLLLSKLATIE